MYKTRTVLLYSFCCILISSYAYSNEQLRSNESLQMFQMGFSKVKSHFSQRTKSTDAKSTEEEPVHGFSYIYTATHKVPSTADCDDLFAQMDQALGMSNDIVFGNSFMGCWTDQNENPQELFVQGVIEPATIKDIPAFLTFLKDTQGTVIGDRGVQLLPLKSIVSRFDLQARFIHTPTLDEALITHTSEYSRFESLREDYGYQRVIHEDFWKPMEQFIPLVYKHFGEAITRLFVVYSLKNANAVLADFERTYLVEGIDQPVKNYIVEVDFLRDCKKEANQHCL